MMRFEARAEVETDALGSKVLSQFSKEKEQTRRSDTIECRDSIAEKFEENSLPYIPHFPLFSVTSVLQRRRLIR